MVRASGPALPALAHNDRLTCLASCVLRLDRARNASTGYASSSAFTRRGRHAYLHAMGRLSHKPHGLTRLPASPRILFLPVSPPTGAASTAIDVFSRNKNMRRPAEYSAGLTCTAPLKTRQRTCAENCRHAELAHALTRWYRIPKIRYIPAPLIRIALTLNLIF